MQLTPFDLENERLPRSNRNMTRQERADSINVMNGQSTKIDAESKFQICNGKEQSNQYKL